MIINYRLSWLIDENQYSQYNSNPHTVEPRFNEPLYNKVLGITNDILRPSNSKMYENVPRYNETSL